MAEKIEYRVRMVPRYMVTRYACDLNGEVDAQTNGSSQHGEFDNFDVAYAVAYALCQAERDRLGWDLSDERIRYPDPDRAFDPAAQRLPPRAASNRSAPVCSTSAA